MPYQTGTATTPANLLSLLQSFATSNGWTLTTDVLSLGQNYVRLVAVDDRDLTIEGDTDGTLTAGLCVQSAKVSIESTDWPVTYRFFSHSAPDFIAAVMNYAVDRYQHLWFGDIVKTATFVGGNWFGACHSEVSNREFIYMTENQGGGRSASPVTTGNGPAAPFWSTANEQGAGYQTLRASFLHAEVDGWIWPGAGFDTDVYIDFPYQANPLHKAPRQPNLWNSQSVLLKMWCSMRRSTPNYRSMLGHIGHMRAIKIDSYNAGDIVTLGSDRWMVFPWHRKNANNPNGGPDRGHTGTFGAAIRYDGP